MADEIAVSFHDSLLRKSDLRLLEEGRWLNDRLIGFMFDYFTHEQFKQISDDVLFISPDVTQFLKLGQGIEIGIFIEPLNLPSHKLVFFVVNDNNSVHSAGGSHWSLLMYKRQANSFHHFDSCSSYNASAAKSLARNVQPILPAKERPSFVEERCPQQQNGYDCGVYVISVAEELCNNFLGSVEKSLSDSVTAEEVRRKRQSLQRLVLELGQKKT